MSKLKQEFKGYMDDLEKNIQNKQDLQYIKERTTEFMNTIIDHMEQILNFKEEKISQIEKIQNEMEEKISAMQQEIEDIEQDIYNEEDYEYDEMEDCDLEIICPYCETEFPIAIEDDKKEVECPECQNIIELDWSGNLEEISNENGCSINGCSKCGGCNKSQNIEQDEEDM